MADARRRTLARQGAKDLPVEVALLRQRMRSGELTHDAVVLLALLFHEPAEQVLGQPAEELAESAVGQRVLEWHEAIVRAGIAALHHELEERRGFTDEVRILPPDTPKPRRGCRIGVTEDERVGQYANLLKIVAALEAWVLQPGPETARAVERRVKAADRRRCLDLGPTRLFRDVAALVAAPDRGPSEEDARVWLDHVSLWPPRVSGYLLMTTKLERALRLVRVRDELVAWILGPVDPLLGRRGDWKRGQIPKRAAHLATTPNPSAARRYIREAQGIVDRWDDELAWEWLGRPCKLARLADPSQLEGYLIEARLHDRRGQHRECGFLAERALRVDPECEEARSLLERARASSRAWAEANGVYATRRVE